MWLNTAKRMRMRLMMWIASIQVLRLPNRARYKGMSEESLQTAAICVLLASGVSHPHPAHPTFPVQHHLKERINILTILKAKFNHILV